jgi:hypothetical protein
VTEPSLLLITRLGLGMSRDEHYRHRVRVAGLALAGSLRAQTEKSFTWVLVIDVRAPPWVDGEIERLATGLSFDIWRRDPTVVGMNPVDRSAITAMTGSRPAILSRCDDDDLLHRTYVARTRQELAEQSPPYAITFVRGGNIVEGKVYPIRYPWISAGLAVLADGQATITAYQYNHNRFGERMRQQGFATREVSTPHPMWLRSISAASDSAACRRRIRRRWWQRPATVVFTEFGATEESVEELRIALAEAPPLPVSGTAGKSRFSRKTAGKSRLARKMELAQRIRKLKAMKVRSDEDEAEIDRLTEALYDL